MFKYILVPATGADSDAAVFSTALSVARRSIAHLEFLHVRADAQQVLMAMASADMGGGAGYDQIIQTLEQEVASRQQKAERAYREFCTRECLPISSDPLTDLPSAEWRMETGDEAAHLAAHGRAADLVVIGRNREGDIVEMGMIEAALMASGRPILIAPPKPPNTMSGTVVIAWKDRPEAARAVAAAQPFIAMADKVIILSVEEGGETDRLPCEGLRHALSWQNKNTRTQYLKSDGRAAVEILLAAAGAVEADLLVMGGYGHSRVREVIFGGFTRRILGDADLPIFMAH